MGFELDVRFHPVGDSGFVEARVQFPVEASLEFIHSASGRWRMILSAVPDAFNAEICVVRAGFDAKTGRATTLFDVRRLRVGTGLTLSAVKQTFTNVGGAYEFVDDHTTWWLLGEVVVPAVPVRR